MSIVGKLMCSALLNKISLVTSPSILFDGYKLTSNIVSPIAAVSFHSSSFFAAGHSKWDNIRHIKAAKDGQRNKDTDKVVQKIRLAIKGNQSTDPKLNRDLANAIEIARAKNVPNSTIGKNIKRLAEMRSRAQSVLIEARAPARNSFFLIEVYTAKAKTTRQDIQAVLKKHGGCVGEKGTASHAFEHKGVVQISAIVSTPDGSHSKLSKDAAEEIAISVEAEEVELVENTVLFECAAEDTGRVSAALVAEGFCVLDSSREYLPTLVCTPTEQELQAMCKTMDKLEMIEEIEGIYHNVEMKQ